MQLKLSFAMLLLCNLVVSQNCNERETDCWAPRQCATCISRRNGRPQTVCSTPKTLQSPNHKDYPHDYCSYSACTCMEKVYRSPLPEVAPSSEQPGLMPNKERKEDKGQPGIVPTTEQINVPYKENAPWLEQLEGIPTNNPSLNQFMTPPYPFSGDDKTIAYNVLDQELDQEGSQNIGNANYDSGLG